MCEKTKADTKLDTAAVAPGKLLYADKAPRKITLREHINEEIEHHLERVEWLRDRRANLSPVLLDAPLEDVKAAARLT